PLVFLLLLAVGAVPLAIATGLLIHQNRELLETEEKRYLTESAQSLSRELHDYLEGTRARLEQLGYSILAFPGPTRLDQRLREPWIGELLERFVPANPNLLALGVLDGEGQGPRLAPADLDPALSEALDGAFAGAVTSGARDWRFANTTQGNEPVAALAL